MLINMVLIMSHDDGVLSSVSDTLYLLIGSERFENKFEQPYEKMGTTYIFRNRN